MRLHIILVIFLLISPVLHGWGGVACKAIRGEWFCSSALYSVERFWDYGTSSTSWHCSRVPGNNYTTTCGYVEVQWKRERSYCCGYDDEGHCDCTAWECVSDGSRRFSITSLGYSYGAWDVAKFDAIIDQLELDSVSQTKTGGFVTDYENDTRIKEYISDALRESAVAKNLSAGCRASPAYGSILGRINYYNTYSGYEDVSYERYRDLAAPNGQKIYSSHGACGEASYEPIQNAADCRNYPRQWMKAVDNALNALELSFDKSDKKLRDLRSIHNDLKKKGVCDEEYGWSPKDACVKMQGAFETIDSGDSSTRSYGRWNRAVSLLNDFKNSSGFHPPDMNSYPEMMELLWQNQDGFIPLATELMVDGEDAVEDAEDIYQAYIGNASGYKSEVDTKYAEMETNELSKITESPVMFEIGEGGFGTIAEKVADFADARLEAEASHDDALSMHSNTAQQSYLRLATESASEAAATYGELAGEADAVLEDAGKVVNETRSQTETVLNQAASLASGDPFNTRARQYYQMALNYFNAGENTDILGRKYENYARAEAYAWMALGEKGALENETSAIIGQLEDLLRRAEIDGINVATEKEMLSYLKAVQNERDISVELQSLIASVLNKAGLKYGYLLDVRSELLVNITASRDCGADLRTSMENAERGIVSGNRMDYMNGIGRLSGLGVSYEEISVELSLCEESIIANSLIISSSLLVERVKLDQATPAALTVLVTNPTTRAGQNIPVEISLDAPLQLLYSDANEGSEYLTGVIAEDQLLTLTFKEIKPYRTYSVRFEKNAVLASTTSLDSTARGTGDGSARVEETRIFELYADDARIDPTLPAGASIVIADIDGKPIDGVFNHGSHTFSLVYNVRDAYSKNKTDVDATQLGTNTQLEYDIIILPAMDLDELPLAIAMDYGNVSGITITAVYGATISEKECGGNVCDVTLQELKKDEEAKVSVSYMILGPADTAVPALPRGEYCIEGIEKKCDPLPANINQTIAMINAANERGDYATAIELKEQLKAEMERWSREQRSMADDYLELFSYLLAEKEDIEAALAIADGLNVSLIDDFNSRKTELDSVLADAEAADTIRGALAALNGVERDWLVERISEFRTDSWNEYNDLKKRLFEAGVTTMPSSFMEVETAMNALEGTGSPTDAVELALKLEAATELVESEESKVGKKAGELLEGFLASKDEITSLLSRYNSQSDAAKGTEWESIFTTDSSDISRLVSEIEGMFGKEDNRLIEKKIELLEKKKSKAEGILEQLKDEGMAILQTATASFEAKKDGMPGDSRNAVENGFAMMADGLASGDYISALKTGKVILRELGKYSEAGEGVSILLIILAVIAVGAAAALYVIKKRGGLEGEIEIPFLKKKEKPARRLERAEQ